MGALADTKLTLYAEDGTTILVINDDADTNEQYSRITWTAPLTPQEQIVYLMIEQTEFIAQSCTTNYTLSISQSVGGDLDNKNTTKTVSPAQAELEIGDPISYTITLFNSDIDNPIAPVTVTDTLPVTVSLQSVAMCGSNGHAYEYSLDTNSNGFIWIGALDARAEVSLCIEATVAATPWNSTNTAWIMWNDETISRSAQGKIPEGSHTYLPIILNTN